MFEKLFLAAVSPGASDWNHTNEHRQQLRAQWARFFQSLRRGLDAGLARAAIHHDHDGDVMTRTITVNGAARPYTDQSIWTGLAGGVYLPAAVAPVGRTADGLPVGMQVIAPYLEDRTAIDVARHLSRATGGYVAPSI